MAALESALVSEFRAYQHLVKATREERRVLVLNDLTTLPQVLAAKEEWVNLLVRLEATRQETLERWAREVAFPATTPTLGTILPYVNGSGERLRSLRQGILALAEELHDLNRGNRALAQSALERVDAMREFLLSLSDPAEGYPPRPAQTAQAAAVLADHWA